VVHSRDVAAFDERAPSYETGWLGRLHHDIADRAVDLALAPTLLGGRRNKARTKRRATRLLAQAGFSPPQWHDLYAVIIRAAVATTGSR
jgi:hypothetical protein